MREDLQAGEARFAMLFPGQGSQAVGMLHELATARPVVIETFRAAADVLGYDLWTLVQEGPAERLNRTEYTQPALLVAGVAVWRCWLEAGGPEPAVVAGHSLGEYTALCCADSLSLEQAVALVAERARCMQEAVPAAMGAMAAILGLEDDQVRELCLEAAQGQVVEAVNFNAPGQVVVAGHAEAVDRALDLAKRAGAKRSVRLPVSVPSHCTLMEAAAQRLSSYLWQVPFRSPRVPVIHNVDVRPHSAPDEIRGALIAQLHRPVRWAESIRSMGQGGVGVFLECGPGRVLSGLVRRIARDATTLSVSDSAALDEALEVVGAASR
jgi:[acyl-carrier-protein] S-malonyltransferase